MALVTLNVGGTKYTTTAATLCRFPNSMLARMFEGDLPPTHKDSKGRHFIDRDGDTFKWILRYLRDENAGLPTSAEQLSALKQEAEFFQLSLPPLRRVLELLHNDSSACNYGSICGAVQTKLALSDLKGFDTGLASPYGSLNARQREKGDEGRIAELCEHLNDLKLNGLAARLCQSSSRFGPKERPLPATVTSSFSGGGSVVGDFGSSIHEEASSLKMEWIRRAAPMPALYKAIEALLDAFWAQEPLEQSLPPDGRIERLEQPQTRELKAQDFHGPSPLLFLEVLTEHSSTARVHVDQKWKFVPADLQDDVQRWYLLFCYELGQLGYSVHETHTTQLSASNLTRYVYETTSKHYINIAGSTD